MLVYSFFFFKQKTAYEMRISDWSSDVCSSDLYRPRIGALQVLHFGQHETQGFGMAPNGAAPVRRMMRLGGIRNDQRGPLQNLPDMIQPPRPQVGVARRPLTRNHGVVDAVVAKQFPALRPCGLDRFPHFPVSFICAFPQAPPKFAA